MAPRSGGALEIPQLSRQRTLERGPCRAALDIGPEARLARDDVGVIEDAQYRRHHQIASREVLAIQERLAAERPGESGQALLHERHRAGAAQSRPLLIGVE